MRGRGYRYPFAGAVIPSTDPGAAPANNIANALKCDNAIVLPLSPKAAPTLEALIGYIHAELDKFGLDRDLVQMIPVGGPKEKTQRLLENVDMIVAKTADLADAAQKIAASKIFDDATSCAYENAIVVVDTVYDAFAAEMAKVGSALITNDSRITSTLWVKDHLTPHPSRHCTQCSRDDRAAWPDRQSPQGHSIHHGGVQGQLPIVPAVR